MENGATVKEDMSIEVWKQNGEDKVYAWSILFNEIRWLNISENYPKVELTKLYGIIKARVKP